MFGHAIDFALMGTVLLRVAARIKQSSNKLQSTDTWYRWYGTR